MKLQGGKVVAGYEHAFGIGRLAAVGEVGAEITMSRDLQLACRQAFDVAKERIAEDLVDAPGIARRPGTGRGPGEPMLTMSLGAGTGSRCSSKRSNTEKIAVLTPMPRASHNTAPAVTRWLVSDRIA